MSNDKTIAEAKKETAAANSGENAPELKAPVYVIVTHTTDDEEFELPTGDDNLLGLSTLQHTFPGAHGLKYQNPATGASRVLMIDSAGTKIQPPPGGWAERRFIVTYPRQPTAQRSLSGDPNPKRKKMMDESIASDSDGEGSGTHFGGPKLQRLKVRKDPMAKRREAASGGVKVGGRTADVRPQTTTTICKCLFWIGASWALFILVACTYGLTVYGISYWYPTIWAAKFKFGDGFWFSTVFAAAAVSFLVNFVPAFTTYWLEASHKKELENHFMLIMNGTMNSEAPKPDPPSFAMWNAVVTGIACGLSALIAGAIFWWGECRKDGRTPAGADGNGPLLDGELEKCTDQTARIELELEKADIKKQEQDFLRKEKELAEKERLAPWNVDTIGKEAWSKSIVNKVTDKKPAPPPKNEGEESDRMMKYFKDNKTLLDKFARLKGFDQCEKFLLEHPHLCSEFATSYLTIEALNLTIDEKHDEMAVYAGNCITLQYLLELAKNLHALATNKNVIKKFFKKIRAADASYMKMYSDLKRAFYRSIAAKAKRLATDAKEKLRRIQESPGSLDPQEVFESLPESMQEAFTSQSVEKLQDIATTMDSEVFQYHLNRCIASGPWVPTAKDAEEDVQLSSKA